MALCFLSEKEMAAGTHREIHDVEQSKKVVPLITCGTTCGQHVRELVLGVNKFDLDFEVQIGIDKQPILRDSVGSGCVSHRRTPAFDDHFDHHFIVFEEKQLRDTLRRVCVCDTVIHIGQFINISFPFFFGLELEFRNRFWVGDSAVFEERNTSITTFHKSRARSPSILKPASNEITSDSVEL